MDSRVGGLLHVSLINSVAQNKHVIDTNTNQQEGHELMHASGLATAHVHETEAGSEGEQDAKESNEGNDATAVHGAEVTEHAAGVDADAEDGELDEREVLINISDDRFHEALCSEHMNGQ